MPQQTTPQQNHEGGGSRGEFLSAGGPDVGLPWRLMIFTFVLFMFSVLIFAGLRWGYATYLDDQINQVDQQMEELATQVSEGEKERFLTFYSQLVNLRNVLDRRSFSQNIFGFLESKTISSVYYQDAEYVSDQRDLLLSGRAQSMSSFVDQMQVFDQAEEVDSAVLEEVSVERGELRFDLRLMFNSEFLNQPMGN